MTPRHLTGLLICAAAFGIPFVAAAQEPRPGDLPVCQPACRGGFVCASGQCVSACNPACAPDQTCTANAACVPTAAPVAPGVAAGPPYGTPGYYPPPPGYYPPPPGYYPPPAYLPPRPSPGAHTHDGFFLRLGTGLAYGSFDFSDSVAGDSKVTGPGIAIDITIGGAIRPGLILAGSISGGSYPEPKVKPAGQPSMTATDETLTVFGGTFLVDYYPDATRGFHFGGDVGIGGASVQNSRTGRTSDHNPSGFSGGGHVGYEVWISDQWSVGGMLKLSYVYLRREATEGYSSFTVSGFQPLFMLAFTFN